MPNASHCRFSNTLDDLEDCMVTLSNMEGEELDAFLQSGTAEAKAAARLISMCGDISKDYDDDIKALRL